jgi:hypothetical protein
MCSIVLNGRAVSDALDRMWKEANLKVVSQNFPAGTDDNHDKPQSW